MTARIADGVTHITEPHVHPLLRCNVWHVRGRDRDLVVDTSLGLRPLRHLVEDELGHELLAVATHVHGDHVGGMHEFDARAIHAAEAGDLAAAGTVTVDASMYGPRRPRALRRRRLRRAGPARRRRAGGRPGERARSNAAPRRRRACSTTATSSTSATGRSRSSTCPGTPPAASGCGRRRPASCSRATRSTTARCSTSSTAATSRRTWQRCDACARCRSASCTAATNRASDAAASSSSVTPTSPPGPDPLRRRAAGVRSSCHDTSRIRRTWRDGRPDGRAPGGGRPRRDRLQPHPVEGRPVGRAARQLGGPDAGRRGRRSRARDAVRRQRRRRALRRVRRRGRAGHDGLRRRSSSTTRRRPPSSPGSSPRRAPSRTSASSTRRCRAARPAPSRAGSP